MKQVAIFDNVTGKRLCFLENAYNVGYTLNLNKLHAAKFTLPYDDPKNAFCQPYRWVEIWDETRPGAPVGLFRILPSAITKKADTRAIDYTCEHVLATLMDDVLFGWHEIGNLGVYTSEVIDYVLRQQRTPRWTLQTCGFTHQYLYGWENENLLAALFSVATCFAEPYTWSYDTTGPGALADATLWTRGSLASATGNELSTSTYTKNRIRTSLLTTDYLAAKPGDGYRIAAYVYNSGGTYQGIWNGSGLGTTVVWFTGQINFMPMPAGSRVRLIASKTDNSSWTNTADSTAAMNAILLTKTANTWRLFLNTVSTDPVAEIRYKKNMLGITKTVDPSQMATRLIPLGYGEGVNQLDISSKNGGSKVLEADTISTYGEITRLWIDRRYQDVDSLYAAAVAMLEELKQPYISYEVETTLIGSLAGVNVGDYVRVIDDEDGTDFNARVITFDKPDVYGNPTAAKITLANRSKDIATSLADMADRSRINEVYAQGAVTLYTMSFADNCANNYPAVLKFPIPDNVVHLNSIKLSGQIEAFRGYSQVVESTTINLNTTNTGGGSTQTSSATVLEVSSIQDDDGGGPGHSNHNHGIQLAKNAQGDLTEWLSVVNSSGAFIRTTGFVASGSHEHEGHTHTVTVPEHSHGITMPAHTHPMSYDIYTGETADYVEISVDGTTLTKEGGSTHFESSDLSDVDITAALTRQAGSTEISRGWHTITLTPNKQTRLNLSLAVQLFANSRGGGQY